MRILYLCPFLPSLERPDAVYHPQLLSRHHEVTAVFLASPSEPRHGVSLIAPHIRDVHVLELRRNESIVSCVSRLPTAWPLYLAYYFNARLRDAIHSIAVQARVDVVHAHTLRMATYASILEARLRVCNIQDVLTSRYERFVRQPSATWPLDVEEWIKLRRFEPALWRRLDRIGVVSEDEATDACRVSDSRIAARVIRPGLDKAYFEPLADARRTSTLIFVGRYSYRPNVEAAIQAARAVFPLVRARVPEARLSLVGSDPPATVRGLAAIDGVTVLGRVDDIRPMLGSAGAALCPMASGGGVKYKVLEALAMATPVVTNERGARGTGLINGVDVLIGNDVESMAEACVRLLTDRATARRFGEAGRATVLARHSWDAVGASLEAFYA